MTESKRGTDSAWVDPGNAPEWTDEMWDVAQVSIGGKVIREATGYLGRTAWCAAVRRRWDGPRAK